MTGSSPARSDAFDGLLWGSVWSLVCLLREAQYTRVERIEALHSQRAVGFQGALRFLLDLRAVRLANNHLQLAPALESLAEADARRWIVEQMLRRGGDYRSGVLLYLRQFTIAEGEPTFSPPEASRHLDSDVRNLLMGMGIVLRDDRRDCYTVAPEYMTLYAAAQEPPSRTPPRALLAAREARESLGLRAEQAVVESERNRLGEEFSDRVLHVALVNVAAGYDIRSLTVGDDGITLPRYIEVKAVSSSSLQFYWSRNEMAVAKHLADWYFLYLVPVTVGGRFDMRSTRVIPNPHLAVFESSGEWLTESEVVRCWLAPNDPKESGESGNTV